MGFVVFLMLACVISLELNPLEAGWAQLRELLSVMT